MSYPLLRKSKTLLSLLLRIIGHFLILNKTTVERIGYLLLRKSKNFFILDLKEDIDLGQYYTLYDSYESYDQYLEVQRVKTKRRLKVFTEESKSIMWTSITNIRDISKIIKNFNNKSNLAGLCMGSRSGEEQILFQKFLGNKSKVLGVELTPDAADLPNTIIADFHFLPKNLHEKFDFVYSNSHDQSFNPKLAIGCWIKCLKIGGLLILEHSRSHGKSYAGRQDLFGVETEILPYLIMEWFTNKLRLEGIHQPSQKYGPAHKYLVFSRKV